MTQLIRALSEQAATVTPSPPAVAFERAGAQRAPATPTQHPVESIFPAADKIPEQPLLNALKAAAQQIESYLRSTGRELTFSVDQTTSRTVVTVRDTASGEVIRQIPSEEALRLAHSLGKSNALVDISI